MSVLREARPSTGPGTLPDAVRGNPRLARLEAQANRWPATQLGVGVVSGNVVDAAVDLAAEFDISLMLIASRRQVDAAEFGGGYVDGMTPGDLVQRVEARGGADRVLVCRDHGGPWQGASGIAGSVSVAMDDALTSFQADVDAGFDLLHIDTSVDDGHTSSGDMRDRLLRLYMECWEMATIADRPVAFEVGDEEQVSVVEGVEEPRRLLAALAEPIAAGDVPRPLFVVAQTGTKVMERRNVGSLVAPYRIDGQMPSRIYLPQVMELLRAHSTHLKQHNTDYLPTEVLAWHPLLGVHAANVAPEFGIEESLGLLAIMERVGAADLVEAFLSLAYDTRKWEKWELPDSDATDRERALWAGHYVFGTEEYARIRGRLADRTALTQDDINRELRQRIRAALLRYVYAFRIA